MEAEASPTKSLIEEIETFRLLHRATLKGYTSRIDEELATVRKWVEDLGHTEKISAGKMRDIRDMLTLLRNVDVKPEKGRRKDLKKLDSIVSDLAMMIEH